VEKGECIEQETTEYMEYKASAVTWQPKCLTDKNSTTKDHVPFHKCAVELENLPNIISPIPSPDTIAIKYPAWKVLTVGGGMSDRLAVIFTR
jgi:hypothetical protein